MPSVFISAQTKELQLVMFNKLYSFFRLDEEDTLSLMRYSDVYD